jgi:hypothetical protein
MSNRIIQTSKQLAAERQIHAAIVHFRNGEFECAISLCSAAEGQMPEPDEATHLFAILRKASAANPSPEGQKEDFNYAANWMKHGWGVDAVEIEEWEVTCWLNRAISKYRAVYGSGTPEMLAMFSWAE